LTADRVIVRPEDRYSDAESRRIVNEYFNDQRGGMRSEFWDDGTPRITGREYNALLETACYQRGKLRCVSCHSMHESDPNDQIAAKMETNQACYQCHAEYQAKLTDHTHHQAGSSGSQCYNCHMPNTTYGLLEFSRSHKIDSPSVTTELHSGRPNACVLCHLDQSLPWAAKNLASWYGQPEPPLDEAQSTVSAGVLYGLRGDPCQRALIGWHMRWEPARAVSGSAWLAPTITQLLTDPYSAVRYQAAKTLKTLPGLEKLPYDYIAPAEFRAMRQQQAAQWWDRHGAAATDRRGPEVLLQPDGKLMHPLLQQLLRQRDNRPMQCIN
jgi:predicted CXXCH cytochrome family protein